LALDFDADEVFDGDVAAVVGFVVFFDVAEDEGYVAGVVERAGGEEFFGEGDEVVVGGACCFVCSSLLECIVCWFNNCFCWDLLLGLVGLMEELRSFIAIAFWSRKK